MDALQFYKCLADETRLKILLLVCQEDELCVCELIEALTESQPKISRHLALLRKCGLMSDRRQGQWVFYRLHDQLPQWQREVLTTTLQSNQLALRHSLQNLNEMTGRPQRVSCC